MKTMTVITAAAIALAGTTSAHAVETIALNGPNSTVAERVIVRPTVTVRLRGFTFSVSAATFAANPGAVTLTAQNVRTSSTGVGVAGDGQPTQVDNEGVNELLEVSFDGPARYRITGATFAEVDSNDTLALYGMTGSAYTRLGFTGDLDGTPALTGSFPATRTALGNGRFSYTFGGNAGYDAFRFGSNLESADGFALQSISIAAVPEPVTWVMMILGFGVIGGALRRRTAATARVAFG